MTALPVMNWLLEEKNPGVRYIALRDLLGLSADDPQLSTARGAAYIEGPINRILSKMMEEGYWVKPGPGYSPKYKGTVWSVITLAQLGASLHCDDRIANACQHLLQHALTPHGQFAWNGRPDGTLDCLQGNLCAALTDLGVDDPRLDAAYEWMARSITGEGVSPMKTKGVDLCYERCNVGPLFACRYNNDYSCAWGAVKALLAFGKLPSQRRTPLIERAIDAGVGFLFGVDPAQANLSRLAATMRHLLRCLVELWFPDLLLSGLVTTGRGIGEPWLW
jgi:hypothetical protein